MPGENFIPALNTVRCTVWQEGLGQKFCNTIYVQNSTAWNEASMIALGENVTDAWNEHIAPLQVDDIRYSHVSLRDMTTFESFGMDHAFNPLSGGDRLLANLPLNVAVSCKLTTNFSGRSRRGRLFISGLEEDQVNDNKLTDAARLQFENNLRSFVQAVNADVGDMVVASFYSGGELRPGPHGQQLWKPKPRETALLTTVQNVFVDVFTDSMRRRLEGRGN